jgi:hypothetical protein
MLPPNTEVIVRVPNARGDAEILQGQVVRATANKVTVAICGEDGQRDFEAKHVSLAKETFGSNSNFGNPREQIVHKSILRRN